ncbi:recombinase family protein [Deinococcus rubellus]|uniref:recombinase family protein n=1 Tax=Deinococcus rubellus TaxID=1889240 RepID=UPI0031EFB088
MLGAANQIHQNTARQLDGLKFDKVVPDKVSGANASRPQLIALLDHTREGDTVVVHSMDRLARNLDDLRALVYGLTAKGVCIEFVKEGLTFTGEDTAISKVLLSVMGAFAEFERALIRERQREGIEAAKKAGVYKGRSKTLTAIQVGDLQQRAEKGESKASLARDFSISREIVYQYLKAAGT